MVFADEYFCAALFPRYTKTKQTKNNGRDLMTKTTLTELNEKFKECPTRTINRKDRCGQLRSNWLLAQPKVVTAEYYINSKKIIVKSHFVGTKDLNKVLYDIAYNKAMSEMLNAG